ncbi:MAG: hypothetical protein GY869_06625, partial [Planctomycetes bacterium]|nr:hypothetical protein [Planctomycetota bacterium]
DDSDDYRLIPLIIDDAGPNFEGDDMYALESWGDAENGSGDLEHSVSGGNDDPFTDWVYWYQPIDTSPGEACYLEAEAAMLAGDYDYTHVDEEIMARTVLVNWNGGSEPPFNQDCPEQGTVFRITTSKPLTEDDVYTFRTIAPAKDTLTAGREFLKNIKVVPNPLFINHNRNILTGEAKITFTHLPTTCTIRIFNLAAERVRRIDKDDPITSVYEWDLQNDSGRKVANGIYIWYLESEYGTKQGKMAIFRD